MMMVKFLVTAFLILLLGPNLASSDSRTGTADWTIMIYMNGDNNLEPDALWNFAQLAQVGSSEKVHFVVQLDRIGKYANTTPDWSQTLRFYMRKGIEAKPKYAIEDLGEQNMGSGPVLTQFVIWARQQYPAKHYMLVIWDHGQGWRNLDLPLTQTASERNIKSNIERAFPGKANTNQPFRSSPGAPYRSVSNDETNNNDVLYNREIHDALKKALGKDKLDVIGFDACLMSMIETAYAMRDVARYMIGSEELEPGEGWNYKDWATRINEAVPTNGAALGKATVASYKAEYDKKETPETTLSAVNLGEIGALTDSIDSLGKMLKEEVARDISAITRAREATATYAPGKDFYHVDLGKFLEELSLSTQNTKLRNASSAALSIIQQRVVIANYAGSGRKGSFGSTGLAIYFPSTLNEYRNDVYAENGYEKGNKKQPVAFVEDNSWPDFIHLYLSTRN